MRYLIIDVSTAPLENVSDLLPDDIQAPDNYKSPEAIAKYVAAERERRIEKSALDCDLARITGLGLYFSQPLAYIAKDEEGERELLRTLASWLTQEPTQLVTFNGFAFDIPMVMRRALYLGIRFPKISTDRFKSEHHDLCEWLCDRNPQRRKSLSFYAKRLGIDSTKALTGKEEGRIFEHQRWDDLESSLKHDVMVTRDIARWAGVIS